MKAGLLLCLLSTLLVPGLASQKAISFKHYRTAQSTAVQAKGCGEVSNELCQVCIQFAVEAINIILNLILDDVVVAGCGDLCGLVAKETNKITGEICDILCVLVGFDEFIKLIEKADLDPIYYCELLDVCAINDNGDAKILGASVTPKSGPQGQFVFAMNFTTIHGTGTGELAISIDTVDGIPVGNAHFDCSNPGTYNVGWTLDAEPSSDCENPPCEMWLPGTYNVTMAVCDGECGSKHPHSAIYDETHLIFTITG